MAMNSLAEGSTGTQVAALQSALYLRGFSPGAIDGNFGASTTAALKAFQSKNGLTADGVVGTNTASALGLSDATTAPSATLPAVTVAVVSKMFPATPVVNISTNLPHVLSSLVDAQLTATPMVLAALATIRAETEGFKPISEYQSSFNTSPGGSPFGLYDNRRELGNTGPPDGANFRGRGYVQLTGRANYAKFGPLIGISNLVDNPDQANDPVIAANILAAFVASKKGAIATALAANDLAAARRLVNGGSNGLDRFSEAYTIGLGLLAPTR